MLESLLAVKNFYWAGESFCPFIDLDRAEERVDRLRRLVGQFAFAQRTSADTVLLARDRLGINKLFFAIHESGRLVAANYLADLVTKGIPFEATYSVPAGYLVEIDATAEALTLTRFGDFDRRTDTGARSLRDVAQPIREQLELWFTRLARQFNDRTVCVSLSGGLDSGLIAALARKHFPDVIAYTYAFQHGGDVHGEDADYAQRLAEYLHMPLRLVPAASDAILEALTGALRYGQDWRDFNVHCAIVNWILAAAIASDPHGRDGRAAMLVLTGDLMNEFMADYAPVVYGGREYYRLPQLPFGALRVALVRGLDAGDREIGIFNRCGLDVIQPYGLLADQYLGLPDRLVSAEWAKQRLVHAVAGDLLPPFMFERTKVRAQIGTSASPVGILPVLATAGRDADWLKSAFGHLLAIDDPTILNQFIRVGRYRFLDGFPRRRLAGGYLGG